MVADRRELSARVARRLRRILRGPGSQAVLLAATTGLAQLLLAALYIVTARATVPAKYGVMVAAIAVGLSAVAFIDFGTNSYWIREIAQSRIRVDELSRRVTGKLTVAAVFAASWTIILGTCAPNSMLWVAGPICMTGIWNQTLQVPLRGLARNDLVALNVLSDKVTASLMFVALRGSGMATVDRLWLSLVAGSLCAGVLGWLWTPHDRRPRVGFGFNFNPWSGAGHYGLSTFAIGAQTYDLPILGLVGGGFAAGVYGAVNRWTQPMGLLSSAFVSASLPFMAGAGSFREGLRIVKRSLWLPFLAAAVSLGVALMSPTIISILLGPAYRDSAAVLQALAFATVLGIINQPLYVFLQARRYDRAVSWLMVAGVTVQLTLVITLGAALGALGAALAIVGLQVILLIGCMTITIRLWREGK